MEDLSKKRPCVMIVDHDLDFGIKLADWLAARGYQAVLVRSIETAIDECRDLHPQVVFIGLNRSEPEAQLNLRGLFRVIETTCPPVPVITMGYRASEKLIQVVADGAVRQVLVKPIGFTYIGRLLQAELNRATASLDVRNREAGSQDGWAVDNLTYEQLVHREATT